MARMPNRHIDVDDLVARRHERNLTQRDLADALPDCSMHIIERWETPSPRRRAVPAVYWPGLKALLDIEPVAGPFVPWTPPAEPEPPAPPRRPQPVVVITGTCPRPCRCPLWACTWCGIAGSGQPEAHRCAFLRLTEDPTRLARLNRALAERDVTSS